MTKVISNWPKKNGLRIGHININSVINKLTDISSILSNSGNPFHIFGVTESRLSNSVADCDVSIPGFNIIRKDPSSSKATGLLIYINESVNFKRLTHLENNEIEAVWLEIKLKRQKPIAVGFLYRNPAEKADWTDKFSTMMDAVALDTSEIILLGDFNIDLFKSNKSWKDKFLTYHLSQLIDVPTRVTATSKTLLDHVYATEPQNITEICVPVFGASDHFPVCITWNKKGVKIPKGGHKYVTYRSFTTFDENNFLTDLRNSSLGNVYNFTDPDKALEYWLNTFTEVYNKHAPFRTHRVKHTQQPKWITKEIEDASRLRDKLLASGNRSEFILQRNKVNSLKRAAKKAYFEDLVSSKQNTKSVWKAINQLTNKQQQTPSTYVKHVSPNELNTYFSTIADQIIPQDNTESNSLDKLKAFCQSKNITSKLTIPPMSTYDVYNALINLKQTGTRGLDGIDGKILKLSTPFVTDTLTYIYNLCIDKHQFPTQFKQAKVIPLFKSGDNSQPSNYRPISVLSLLSKPLEKHIHKHIYRHLDKFDLLHKNQSGFRKNHSCQTTLINLVDKWLNNINNNQFNGVLFIDFTKAFDLIDHDLLRKKLLLYGISEDSFKILSSFLHNRQQTVCINTKLSTPQPVKYGVPQGSVLGPLLFSIYINDLPLYINESCELFCDDTTIHSSHHNLEEVSQSLQMAVNNLTEWCDINHMSLNQKKTKLMLVTTRQKRQNLKSSLPTLHINNMPIEEVDHHKVLGVMIDNNLSWNSHVNYLRNNISKKVYQLCRIKHFLNQHARKLFFNAHILSVINYGSTLYDSASENTLKSLHSVYRRAVKAVLLKSTSLNKEDYKSLNILPLTETLAINKAVLMHKIFSGSLPTTTTSNFQYSTRDSAKFQLPIPRIDLFKNSLCYSGSLLWNHLPPTLRSVRSTQSFKKDITLHYESIYLNK